MKLSQIRKFKPHSKDFTWEWWDAWWAVQLSDPVGLFSVLTGDQVRLSGFCFKHTHAASSLDSPAVNGSGRWAPWLSQSAACCLEFTRAEDPWPGGCCIIRSSFHWTRKYFCLFFKSPLVFSFFLFNIIFISLKEIINSIWYFFIRSLLKMIF